MRVLVVALVLALAPCRAIGDPKPDIRMPPGTRTDATGQLVSGRGLRETTDFLAKELGRRGILVRQVGPYRLRSVEITRFISTTESTSWLAIHVMRKDGKTLIFFVPRSRA